MHFTWCYKTFIMKNFFIELTKEEKEKLLKEHMEYLKNTRGKNFGEIEHPPIKLRYRILNKIKSFLNVL